MATDTHPVVDRGIVVPCPQCGRKNRLAYGRLTNEAHCSACKSAIPLPGTAVEVDEQAPLEELLRDSALPVLIDFWAPWCQPCLAVAPEFAKVAERNAGRLLVVKVNTDVDPAVGGAHGIQAIPTMKLYRGGRELARTSGARPAAGIEAFVRESMQAAS
jgi:thioredoxin 2